MIPSEFHEKMKAAVQVHRDNLLAFAQARSLFKDLTGASRPDWRKVGESLVHMGGLVDNLVQSIDAIDALHKEFTGVEKVNGHDPLPVKPKIILEP